MDEKSRKKLKQYLGIFAVMWVLVFTFLLVYESTSPWCSQYSTSYRILTEIYISTAISFIAFYFFWFVNMENRDDIIRFEFVENEFRKHPMDDVQLPERATDGSVGYDFFAPEAIQLCPGTKHTFFTDAKVKLRRGEALLIIPRSSSGIKKNEMLGNTVGLIDPDYYNNETTGGNIQINVFNYGEETMSIENGERFAQGFIVLVWVPPPGKVKEKRKGGVGSTGV